MSLLHPALLLGLGLATIPVLLHLLLRAKPKRFVFPALRLIKENRRQNVRRLQLRHLWLLLLRILVIGLIVFALARPSLPAANYAFVWYEWATLLLVVGIGLGVYFAILALWQRQSWPRNQFLTRRTMLRGGVGTSIVFLLLLGVVWPYTRRVSAEIKSPALQVADNIPVAAVFLFDTSPSMSYRQGNQTRLQSAQQIARDHLSRLPAGSKVAVTDSYESSSPAFSLDLQSARIRIDAHEVKATGLPLNDRLRTALLAQEEDRRRVTAEQTGPEEKRTDRYLREIYLFTDLARSAWREDSANLLRTELKRLETVGVYLIDVGELNPTNVSITTVKLSRESIPAGATLKLDVLVAAVGAVKPEQTIELLMAGPDGKMIKQNQQSVAVEKGVEKRLTFETHKVEGQYQQGQVRIIGSDPLSIDDVGYFTVQVMPPLKVAIVAEKQDVAHYWKSVLDSIARTKTTEIRTQFVAAGALPGFDLSTVDVLYLINVSALDDNTWTKISNFVNDGGGLGVFLGEKSSIGIDTKRSHLINPVSYDSKVAQTILPAELQASSTFKSAQTMDLRNSQHSLLKRLDEFSVLAELGAIDIRKWWRVAPVNESIVIARYSDQNGSPALVERRVGKGRVILMTTAIDNVEWNDFAGTPTYLVFADQLTQYLSQQSSIRCNDLVGSDVTLPFDHNRKPKKVVIRMPDFKQRTQDLSPDVASIVLRDLETIGSYQVDSAQGEVEFHTGFSLNLPARESDLKRLEPAELDALLGEGRYSVNRDPASLERNVQTGRLGQEAYSMVLAFLIAVFALEQFTATWFYRTDEV